MIFLSQNRRGSVNLQAVCTEGRQRVLKKGMEESDDRTDHKDKEVQR